MALLGFIALTLLAPLCSAGIRPKPWYQSLKRPSWSPPPWIFGPVWILLYVLMAVAAWTVWKKTGWSLPLWLWLIQLALNASWTPVFFGLRKAGPAFGIITLLWLAIAATLISFALTVPWTAWLLAPYLAWVSFAAALNFNIWQLNKN